MKVPLHTLNKLEIVRVFAPSHQVAWDRLYTEFKDIHSANIVNSYARNLQHGLSVLIYPHHKLWDRYSAVKNLDYDLRNSEEKWKTKIKLGDVDFILLKRPNKGGSWTPVSLIGLPPIDLLAAPVPPPRTSPPKGRSRTSKRSRPASSDSPSRDAKNHKTEAIQPPPSNSNPPDPNLPRPAIDPGVFHPSSFLSPKSQATNKNFTFGSSVPAFSLTTTSKPSSTSSLPLN